MADLKLYFEINAEPQDVYACITNPFTIELWSGYPAKMSTTPNSEFELWEGDICGQNIEFEENKLIVQEWYFGDQEAKSIVTIKLHEKKNKTSIELRHTNIPDEDFDAIKTGWTEYYFEAIKEFLSIE